MSDYAGTASIYVDDNGDAYFDEDEVGSLFRGGERKAIRRAAGGGRGGRLAVRAERADRRVARFDAGHAPARSMAPTNAYQAAVDNGIMEVNHYQGLNSGTLNALVGSILTLRSTTSRNLWITNFTVTAVTSGGANAGALYYGATVGNITVAGQPVNVGDGAAPISMFAHDSVRGGVRTSPKLATPGQLISMDFTQLAGAQASISASAFGDELNTIVQQQVTQSQLLAYANSNY